MRTNATLQLYYQRDSANQRFLVLFCSAFFALAHLLQNRNALLRIFKFLSRFIAEASLTALIKNTMIVLKYGKNGQIFNVYQLR